ncbi:MAG: hypothetical protein INR65_15440, partial [Gluconacetobacter diazotrophicus]|nr:hypothetical protein [Gluconacetobacter diazotrophicus]
IKGLVSTSGKQVEDGVKLVDQAGVALERIVEQVAEINGAVTEIAASAQEQATGLAEVNTAVNQMDQVTQQNAAMVEQTTAASHRLAAEAAELGRSIAGFRLGGSPPASPSPSTRALAANRPARRAPPTRVPVPADDDWNEF